MKLFLTSSGITNPTLAKALLTVLGKLVEKSRVTFIPTAANVEKGDKTWLVNDMHNIKKLGFPYFDIVDIAVSPKDVWLPSFEQADLLVFGGGNLSYLLKCFHSSGVWSVFPKLIEDKVYMGISAGSMATAKTVSLSSANILYYEQTGAVKSMKGLGFVDFEIRPHLNSPDFPKVTINNLEKMEKDIPYSFYAIDDNSAVQVVDGKVTVVSEGEWKKFH